MTLIKKKKSQKTQKIKTAKQMVVNVQKDNPEFKEDNNFERTLSKLIKIKPKSK